MDLWALQWEVLSGQSWTESHDSTTAGIRHNSNSIIAREWYLRP